jgi:MoxR-like ATPase
MTPITAVGLSPADDPRWPESFVTPWILGAGAEGFPEVIPVDWARTCAARLQTLRKELHRAWIGLDDPPAGHLLDWLLAGLIARENVLLLGPPGVAKTEIAQRVFELLGLTVPKREDFSRTPPAPSTRNVTAYHAWWQERCAEERTKQKYFQYLLSKFTQTDELFGPAEISLLRQGILAYVNFGLMTGPGVRAAFLDECFKASSAILNSLLTLTMERLYFNWGGMEPADLVMLIGASNELPGGFASGAYGVGASGEDFGALYAFLDRFPLRLPIPLVPGSSAREGEKRPVPDLRLAGEAAILREARQFCTGRHFETQAEFEERRRGYASVNDLMLLGRCCMQQDYLGDGAPPLFDPEALSGFREMFFDTAVELRSRGTDLQLNKITWTVSPRKLRALYKIALAHALVCDEGFAANGQVVSGPGPGRGSDSLDGHDLWVFQYIWDSGVTTGLKEQVDACIKQFGG